MTKKMKEAIEKFKQKNGNDNFSQKEMLMYLIQRIDNLPCDEHIGLLATLHSEVESVKNTRKLWRWFVGVLVTIDFGLTMFILEKIFRL